MNLYYILSKCLGDIFWCFQFVLFVNTEGWHVREAACALLDTTHLQAPFQLALVPVNKIQNTKLFFGVLKNVLKFKTS